MKRIFALALVILLSLVGVGWTATDNFNRASLGSDWTTVYNFHAGAIYNSEAYSGNNSAAPYHTISYWNVDTFSATHYSTVKIPSTGYTYIGPAVRCDISGSHGSCYLGLTQSTSAIKIYKWVDSSYTDLGNIAIDPPFEAGNYLKITATGTTTTTITVYTSTNNLDWTEQGHIDDSTSPLTTGQVGVGVYSAVLGDARIDEWYGGDISFAPSVTTQNASSITKTTAIGNGTITNNGGYTITEVGTCVSTSSANPTKADTYFTGTVVQSGAFTANMTGLAANTTYHYSTYATNSQGTTYRTGNDFTTARNPQAIYVRADGEALTTATATSAAAAATSMNLTVFNATPLLPGDTIYISDAGGDYLIPMDLHEATGTALNPIVVTNVAGQNPTFKMDITITNLSAVGWTDQGGGVWTYPNGVFYVDYLYEDGIPLRAINYGDSLVAGSFTFENQTSTIYYKSSDGNGPAGHRISYDDGWPGGVGHYSSGIILTDANYVTIQKNNTGTIKFIRCNRGINTYVGRTPYANTKDLVGIIIDGLDFTYCEVALSIFPGLFNVDACEFKNNTAYRCASFFQCFQETGPTYYSTFDIHHNTGTDIGSIDGTLNWGLQYNEGPDSTFWYLMPSGGHDQEFIGVQPIRNCNIYNNIATGGNHRFFYLHQNEGNIATGNKFYNNFCYNSRRPGLLFGTPEADSVLEDNYVYNNIIYNPGELAYGYMMNIGAPSGNDENSKNYFYNNVFILTSALDTMVNLDGAGYAGTVWRNNIFIGNGATVVYPRATLGWKDFDYNSYYGFGETMFMNYTWADFIGAQGQEAHSPNGATASVDPKLIGDGTYTSDTGDYKLQATSPCQGAGANLSATVTTDYFGTTRTVPLDIGAYEFLAGGTAWPSMGLGIGTKGGNMPPWIRKKK